MGRIVPNRSAFRKRIVLVNSIERNAATEKTEVSTDFQPQAACVVGKRMWKPGTANCDFDPSEGLTTTEQQHVTVAGQRSAVRVHLSRRSLMRRRISGLEIL